MPAKSVSAANPLQGPNSHGSELSARRREDKDEYGNSLRKAFHEVRDLIVHGRLSPGSWIVEADLARHLSMSRTPVRSALHLLQREGYVLEQPNVRKSRMVVAPLTKEDAAELYSIIGHVEGLGGRGTARLPKQERLEIASQLKVLNRKLRGILEDKASAAGGIFDADRNFHRLIIEAGAGPRLLALHRSIEPQAERYWRLYASSILNDLHLSVAEHETIIEAVVEGDPDRVERALQVNWENGSSRLASVIKVFGERGSW
ncbi:MAG: GntR family transcriptional regulator [Acidobacteriaceae bacterium]